MKIYIYAIYFPTSDKYYIGQTNDLNRRLIKQHLNDDSLVGRALRKYKDWQVLILHTRTDREDANLLEIENIRNFNSIHPNGYNLCAGGEGWSKGMKHTEETIEKMKKPKSEKHKEKLRQAGLGKQNAKGCKHSKESIEKTKQAHLKCKRSKETIEKMKQAHLGKKAINTHSTESEIKRLKTRIKKLDIELVELCF